MADRVRMTSNSVFANPRVTTFTPEHPEGITGEAVTDGQSFETDLAHARDLDRLRLATPVNRADLDGDAAPLEPHFTVSVPDLQRDQVARVAQDGSGDALRTNGPTVSEYVAAGYRAAGYPPTGYASRSTADEIAAAIASQEGRSANQGAADAKDLDAMSVAELREFAAAEKIDLGEAKKKDELQAVIKAALASKAE